jgi:hypothetical protein
MTKTHARIPLVALLVVFGMAAPGSAMAKKTSHKYSASLTGATVATGDGYPAPGGRALFAGRLKTNGFGNGAMWSTITITGQPAPNVISFRGTELDYLSAGYGRTKFTGTSTVRADGSQEVSISGRIVGGSGRYRGATGRYTFNGTVPAGSNVMSGHSSGSILY